VQLCLAGIPFIVGPDAELTAADHSGLARLVSPSTAQAASAATAFRLEIETDGDWGRAAREAHPDATPALVETLAGRVRVTHRRLFAEIDVAARCARVARPPSGGLGIDVALRTALCVALPLYDGLPLHAAGIVVEGRGGVFFGPSGAGKSTLAAACPWTVLSDELVAVFGDPPRVQAAGFWGTHERDRATHETFPVAALVELSKGEHFEMARLGATAALRRLLGVLLVPPEPDLWRCALAIVARLVDTLPVYRMTWTPAASPWDEVRATLLRDAPS
jgi:hypothetical protein